MVRKTRHAEAVCENEKAMDQQQARTFSYYTDEDGMLVVRGRLTPEEGALLVKALETSREELRTPQNGSAELLYPAIAPPDDPSGGQRLADAVGLVAQKALSASAATTPSADRYQVVVHVDQEVLEDAQADGRCALEAGPGVARETARRIACDATICEVQHGPDGEVSVGRKRRVVNAGLRRALKARDGDRCAFPGCDCRGRDAHHVQHWADGGTTTQENLVILCRSCHRLVHEAPPWPAVMREPAVVLRERWVSPDVAIPSTTGVSSWEGEPVDFDWAVEDLLLMRRLVAGGKGATGSR